MRTTARLLGRDDIECALEVVGGGGEVHLSSSFGETAPSHPAQTVAAFPRTEDLFHLGAHAMDRRVPSVEPGERFSLVAAPHRGQNDARRTTFGPNRIAEV